MNRVSRLGHTAQKTVLAVVAATSFGGCGLQEPETAGGPPEFRRLTETQYRNVIADVFGPGIKFGGSFDPLVRTEGLLALGARNAPITASGLEKLERLAESIAEQVVSVENRRVLVGCRPAQASEFDAQCAESFITRTGRMLFRRPLSLEELSFRMKVARQATSDLDDFHEGLAMALTSMLVAPQFLFVIDYTEPDPEAAGTYRLDAFAKAARLSFFLWNTTPDNELLTAAERGDLHLAQGREEQITRLLGSPRLYDGVRAFFSDMLAFDAFETLEKDSILYPAFSLAVAEGAREQTLRTIEDVLIRRNEDYRTLFTTPRTYMSGPLARVYRVPMSYEGNWVPYEFDPEGGRVGIQSHISFAALHAHPGRSSPTLRGKAIRELLLCQKVPVPPGDVDFSQFNDPNSPNKTARDRLAAHSTAPACAGCHKLTDPIGLALEKLDGAGQFRATEEGASIDTSGDLDGVPFVDAVGFAEALSGNPSATSCVVDRLYSYAVGRPMVREDREMLAYLNEQFAEHKYRFPALLKTIATSNSLFAISTADQETASASKRTGSGSADEASL